MPMLQTDVIDRKLALFRRYLADLGVYQALDAQSRRREHYAIERLLQLLCESAADLSLQVLKSQGQPAPGSYREIFSALADLELMPRDLASDLIAACGMRNVLTHLYDIIDLERVIAAIEPALVVYRAFDGWLVARIGPTVPR